MTLNSANTSEFSARADSFLEDLDVFIKECNNLEVNTNSLGMEYLFNNYCYSYDHQINLPAYSFSVISHLLLT